MALEGLKFGRIGGRISNRAYDLLTRRQGYPKTKDLNVIFGTQEVIGIDDVKPVLATVRNICKGCRYLDACNGHVDQPIEDKVYADDLGDPKRGEVQIRVKGIPGVIGEAGCRLPLVRRFIR